MSEVILDTITGKSTATTITIGSTPVVSASANSMTIRGEGSAQTSIQQGLAKCYGRFSASQFNDSFNMSSFTDNSTGNHTLNFNNDMANTNYTNAYASEGGSDVYRYIWESNTATGSTTIQTYFFSNGAALTQADLGDNGYTNHGDLA
tara:strand:+ start:645 stop:1088 length:444 start_codon:yes stop_codon:yes gene_type:complete